MRRFSGELEVHPDPMLSRSEHSRRTKHAGKVFICSRYAGDVARNAQVAERLCRMVVDMGYAPFAPHLLYTRFLDDDDPRERMLGIRLGIRFMEACDEVWVYARDGISEGMRIEMEYARWLGKPVVEIQEVPDCQLIL